MFLNSKINFLKIFNRKNRKRRKLTKLKSVFCIVTENSLGVRNFSRGKRTVLQVVNQKR